MIIVKGRELLIPENERYIGTTYDDNSTVRTFRIPRFHEDGMDKSQLDFYVILNYDDGSDPDAVGVTKSVSDDYIVLEWDVGEDITEHSGCLFLWVRGFDYTGAVRWSSFPGVFYIEGSGTEPSDLSDLEQRISEEDKLIRLAKLYKSQPMTAATVAEMKYRDRIYVYVGDEAGYTYGHWCFWDDDQMAWASGGVYNSAGIETDKTLTMEDFAADAKVVGDEITGLKRRTVLCITPEDYGATGDGVTDDYNAFTSAITFAEQNGILFKTQERTYYISQPLTLHNIDADIYDIVYPGTDYAVTLEDMQHKSVNIHSITALNGSGVQIKTTGTVISWHNHFYFGTITADDIGIHYGSGYAQQYNSICFELIAVNGTCIYIAKSASGWTTETRWYGGRLAGINTGYADNAIIAEALSTSQKFYNVGFEYITNGATLNSVKNYSFVNCRASESITNFVYKLKGACVWNTFYCLGLLLNWLDISENTGNNNNFYGGFGTQGQTPVYFNHFTVTGSHMTIKEQLTQSENMMNHSGTFEIPSAWWTLYTAPPNYFLFGTNAIDVTLPTSVYGWDGVSEITLNLTGNIPASTQSRFIDENGNVLMSLSGKYAGLYKMKKLSATGAWILSDYNNTPKHIEAKRFVGIDGAAAGSYKDTVLAFDHAFLNTPVVTVCLSVTSTNAPVYAAVNVSVVAVTASNVTIRLLNGSNTAISSAVISYIATDI